MRNFLTPSQSDRGSRLARRVASLALGAAAATLLASGAHAAEEVGKSVRIKNDVRASINNRSLAPADPVFASENISASASSHGEIRLNDNSKVLVGENSSISLDDFVVGTRGFSSGSIKVAKGAFRFITGNSPKGSMSIETPVSTIGVRGTVFDVYVAPGGITRVILFRGEVEVCPKNNRGNCVITNRSCDIVETDLNEARELPYLRSGDRGSENQQFYLTDRQTRFQPGWRARTFGCDVRAALDPNIGPKLRRPQTDDKGGDGRGIGQTSTDNGYSGYSSSYP